MKLCIVIVVMLLVLEASCFVVPQQAIDDANLTKVKRSCACIGNECPCADSSGIEQRERVKRSAISDQERSLSDQPTKLIRLKRGGCFCNSHGCACDFPNSYSDPYSNNYVHATHSSSSSSFSSSSSSSSGSITYYG